MKTSLALAALAALMINAGCVRHRCDGTDKDFVARRSGDLSEAKSKSKDEWNRPAFSDMPTHLTPERVHGGIDP